MGNTYRSKAYKRGKHSRGFYNRLIYVLAKRARHRGHKWEIDQEFAIKLIKMDCYLCGAKPANRYKDGNAWEGRILIYQGIDRIDNKIHYTNENARPCCKKCNAMKMDDSLNKFEKHINKILNYGGIKLGIRKPIQLKLPKPNIKLPKVGE